MIEAKRITFGYHDVEDRLRLVCSNEEKSRCLLLTRRITRRLLSSFAKVLATSSAAAARAPAAVRQEVLVLEHFSSLHDETGHGKMQDGPTETPPDAPPPPPPVDLGTAVVWKVDVTIEPRLFKLVFHSTEEALVSLTLTRGDFHKLLSLLDHLAETAEWDIAAEAGWLSGAEALISSTGGRTAS